MILDSDEPQRKLTVLVFVGYYLPGYKGGGPIKTIVNLIDRTSDAVSYDVFTGDRDLDDENPYSSVKIGQWNQLSDSRVFYSETGMCGIKQVFKTVLNKEYDIVYLNSFFSIRFSLIPLLLAKLSGKVVVLGPRGEFSEGALSLKAFKKKVFISLYKLFFLNRKTVFQASSDFELADIKKTLGTKSIVFVAEDIGSQEYAENTVRKNSEFLKLVFISRISPMKNLLYALDVLSRVQSPVVFDIYGPIEDQDYWNKCESLINILPDNIIVNYEGMIHPSKVVETLTRYDLFFLPTKGENYGHVIAEALAAGLPILIADTTPWRDLVTKGIGWDISLEHPEHFVTAIEDAFAMPSEKYQKYRTNVLSWAKQKFAQPEAIITNKAMFKFALKNK